MLLVISSSCRHCASLFRCMQTFGHVGVDSVYQHLCILGQQYCIVWCQWVAGSYTWPSEAETLVERGMLLLGSHHMLWIRLQRNLWVQQLLLDVPSGICIPAACLACTADDRGRLAS